MVSLRIPAVIVFLAAALAISSSAVYAASDPEPVLPDHHSSVFGDAMHFHEQGGEEIFTHVCAGCHMPDARGAVGAGAYPKLAGDSNLEVAGYPVALVLHGQNAMPVLGVYLSDKQVADVVNYVRTHFGNDYKDAVTESDVKAAR